MSSRIINESIGLLQKCTLYDIYDNRRDIVELSYGEIGKRIAERRRKLGLKQSDVEERANIGYKYLSNIERGISIPSTEVVMRLAIVLDTTPDEFLVGTVRNGEERWKDVAEGLKRLSPKQLELAEHFIRWLSEENL